MDRLSKIVKLFPAVAMSLFGCIASAETTEILALASHARTGSDYRLISLRQSLGVGPLANTPASNLKLRFDLGQSTYDTSYDATSGTGKITSMRLLLTYGAALGDSTTAKVSVGFSRQVRSVAPMTISAPAETAENGYFIGAEIEHTDKNGGWFQLVLEHDSVAADFAQASYLFKMGPVQAGPVANWVQEGSYSRTGIGVAAKARLAESTEVTFGAVSAREVIAGGAPVRADYAELALRLTF